MAHRWKYLNTVACHLLWIMEECKCEVKENDARV
jgi:hypothetical protein